MGNAVNSIMYREYRAGDETEIVKLLDLVFRGWPKLDLREKPIDHWRWKFQENPFRLSVIAVCEFENQIIGCNHTVPQRIKVGDEIVFSGFSADLCVHPDFRRRGISGKLIGYNSELRRKVGMRLDIAATSNPLLIKSRERDKTLKEFPMHVKHRARIRDFGLHLKKIHSKNAWMKKLGFRMLKLMDFIRNTPSGYESKKPDFKISDIYHFDDRIDEFWEAIKDHYLLIVERSKEYLNWRYCDRRGGEYLIKIAEEDGVILGYIVLRNNMYQKDYPRGYIVDLLTLPDRLDVVVALTEEAIRFFDGQNVNMINSWVVGGHPYEKVLGKQGFVDIGMKPYLYYDSVGLNLDEITDNPATRLHFTYGNMDWI